MMSPAFHKTMPIYNSSDKNYPAEVGAVRFLLPEPFFFVRTTVIGSGVCELGREAESDGGNERKRAGVVERLEVGTGCSKAPSGISPSLSTTNDCKEKVSEVVLRDGSLLSINFRIKCQETSKYWCKGLTVRNRGHVFQMNNWY